MAAESVDKIINVQYDPDKDVYVGTYGGPVKQWNIVAKIGEGSWGHRFLSFGDGHFVYVKVAD